MVVDAVVQFMSGTGAQWHHGDSRSRRSGDNFPTPILPAQRNPAKITSGVDKTIMLVNEFGCPSNMKNMDTHKAHVIVLSWRAVKGTSR
jgi:hypothetical protein